MNRSLLLATATLCMICGLAALLVPTAGKAEKSAASRADAPAAQGERDIRSPARTDGRRAHPIPEEKNAARLEERSNREPHPLASKLRARPSLPALSGASRRAAPPAHPPASWIDLTDEFPWLAPFESELLMLAQSALEESSGGEDEDPSTPPADFMESSVMLNDSMFKQRFGKTAWLRHHAESYLHHRSPGDP